MYNRCAAGACPEVNIKKWNKWKFKNKPEGEVKKCLIPLEKLPFDEQYDITKMINTMDRERAEY